MEDKHSTLCSIYLRPSIFYFQINIHANPHNPHSMKCMNNMIYHTNYAVNIIVNGRSR